MMTGKECVRLAMAHEPVERVPVFCQLAIGHYMRHTHFPSTLIWYSPDALSSAYVELAREYRFDGILVNLPGRPGDWRRHVVSEERGEGELRLTWDAGGHSVVPDGDNVHYFSDRQLPSIGDIDPEALFYIEPHNITEVKYPFFYDFGEYRPGGFDESFFPPYVLETLRLTIGKAGEDFHVSSEVFSPFTQLMELLGYGAALMALVDEPDRCAAILGRLAAGASVLARMQIAAGADAVLVSSAFAGGGFISRDFYRRFVLPFEARIADAVHAAGKVPVYVHTCGKIGDRIDLIREAGYDGVDTMDPPPLGDTDIVRVKHDFGRDLFLKGNVDPVNVVLKGDRQAVLAEAGRLIAEVGRDSGYILSTACSVAPDAPRENIRALSEASLARAGALRR